MIDESLSNWWASFKVNSGTLSTRCWLSPLFLAFFKPSFHLHQSAFLLFSHPVLPDPSLFLPLSPLQCQSPVPYPTPSFSSLSYRWPHPAIFLLFFWPLMVSSHKSLCQLSRSVSLYHSPSPLSCRSFFYCPIHIVSHSLGVSLSGS